MREEKLNALVEKWVYAAPDLGEFYERYDQREEYKRQLREQFEPTENYRTAYEFFYG